MVKRRFDESDARIRPARSTRPRSKDRPDYSAATSALVIGVERGRYQGVLDNGTEISAMKSRELGKNAIVVGDKVGVVGDLSGADGSLARIVSVLERKNSLTRTIDDAGAFEKTIAANVDQMVIVSSVANPEPRIGFVDRCLAVAFDQGIAPIIVMTKADLGSSTEFLNNYAALNVKVFTVRRDQDPNELRSTLLEKVSVFIGHSGVGKSTLVNLLLGNESRRTGQVNEVTGRGRHTSSSAVAMQVSKHGWIIDTPGIRSFGLEHVDSNRIIASFAELSEVISRCPKNCSHDEAACELNGYLSENPDYKERISSLRRLLSFKNQPIA